MQGRARRPNDSVDALTGPYARSPRPKRYARSRMAVATSGHVRNSPPTAASRTSGTLHARGSQTYEHAGIAKGCAGVVGVRLQHSSAKLATVVIAVPQRSLHTSAHAACSLRALSRIRQFPTALHPCCPGPRLQMPPPLTYARLPAGASAGRCHLAADVLVLTA